MKRIKRPLSRLEPTPFDREVNVLENQSTYVPRSIGFEDIDEAVLEWFKTRDLIIQQKKTPVFFLGPEKWAEFEKTWEYEDGESRVDRPYVTVRRTPGGVQPAQNPQRGRIPGKKFTTFRVPIYANAGITYRHYKVPQPVRVDLEYEVRVLTSYMEDSNAINEELIKHFASIDAYINIDGHWMPMIINSVSDESTSVDDPSEERILHTIFSMNVQGYIIDENEFEYKDAVAKVSVTFEETTD